MCTPRRSTKGAPTWDRKSKASTRGYVLEKPVTAHATQMEAGRAAGRENRRRFDRVSNLVLLVQARPLTSLEPGRLRDVLGLGQGARCQGTIPLTERARIRRETLERLTGVHPLTDGRVWPTSLLAQPANHTDRCITSPTVASGARPDTYDAATLPSADRESHGSDAIGRGAPTEARPRTRTLRARAKPDASAPQRVARALRRRAEAP